MKKKILGVFVSLLVVVMLVLSMSTAYAKKPYEVSGTIVSGAASPSIRYAGINTFMSFNTASVWTGDTADDISGTTIGTQTWILHGNEKNPHMNIPDVKLFFTTATVGGLTGQLTIRLRLLFANPALNPNPNFPSHGTWRIIDATGDLEGLHGGGEWIYIPRVVNRYEGTIHFDP